MATKTYRFDGEDGISFSALGVHQALRGLALSIDWRPSVQEDGGVFWVMYDGTTDPPSERTWQNGREIV